MKKVYCHTSVIFTDDDSVAVIKGKIYDIIEENNKRFMIINEQNYHHTFSLNPKKHYYYGRWFYTIQEVRKKKLEKIKYLNK